MKIVPPLRTATENSNEDVEKANEAKSCEMVETGKLNQSIPEEEEPSESESYDEDEKLVSVPLVDDDDDDFPAPDLPDNSHFKFKPGQRVELIRAGRGDDEVTSSGTIVSGFEGVFEVCYKVKLDNGLYKEAVPEDEISDKVSSDMGDLFGEW